MASLSDCLPPLLPAPQDEIAQVGCWRSGDVVLDDAGDIFSRAGEDSARIGWAWHLGATGTRNRQDGSVHAPSGSHDEFAPERPLTLLVRDGRPVPQDQVRPRSPEPTSRGYALLEVIRYVLEERGAVWGPAAWWDTADAAFPTVRIPLQPHRWAVVTLDTRGWMSIVGTADPTALNYRDMPELLPAPDLAGALRLALQTVRAWADRSDDSRP